MLTFTDCAVVRYPTAPQLADIAIAAAVDRRRIVGDEPRVALLSFSTRGSGEWRSVDLVRDALALIRHASARARAWTENCKGTQRSWRRWRPGRRRTAPSAGRANVLVFPSLDAGNIAYKLVQRLAVRARDRTHPSGNAASVQRSLARGLR